METINKWSELLSNTFSTMGSRLGGVVLDLLFAMLILIVGWFVAKYLAIGIKKLLLLSKIDVFFEKLNLMRFFEKANWNIKISDFISIAFKWLLLLIFLIAAADILQWNILSNEMGNLLNYLPKLFSGIVLFLIGMYFASFIRTTLNGLFKTMDISGGRFLSSFVYYLIAILVSITALNQAAIKTDIITNNLTIFLGAFLLALALAFGLGSKEIINKILLGFYSKKSFSIGDKITFKNIKGEIISFDAISVTIQAPDERIVIPIEEFTNMSISIQNKE